mgnify:CR=1 FL=1
MGEANARILLVDDEDSIQTLLTYPLRKEGYEVVSARDGREALDRFAEGRFDLVVLDVMMPRLDGIEVCRRLRARSQVPIIMLTARDDEVDKVLGLEIGADDYITKPFSVREFRSRVKAALRRTQMLGAGAGVERGEDGDGARAGQAHAVQGEAVGEGGGGDLGHGVSVAACKTPCRWRVLGESLLRFPTSWPSRLNAHARTRPAPWLPRSSRCATSSRSTTAASPR